MGCGVCGSLEQTSRTKLSNLTGRNMGRLLALAVCGKVLWAHSSMGVGRGWASRDGQEQQQKKRGAQQEMIHTRSSQ